MQTITPEQITDEYTMIDTRTPKEYENHHIPGAISVPLFTNLEHHDVGYLYKQVSIADAYDKALNYAQESIPRYIEAFKKYKDKKLLIYCARGGLRSGIIAAFLKHHGFDVTKLEKGMKGYRNMILKDLENIKIPPMIILHGLAGAGKTKYIEKLQNKVDLEACAQHRSSVFGDIALKPNSQKQFLFYLRKALLKVQDKPFIFVELESRKIGNLEIPKRIWEAMAKGEVWFLEVNEKNRMQHCLDAFPAEKKYQQSYIDATKKLQGKIANKILQEIIVAFENEEYEKAWLLLWKYHYDPTYIHGTKHLKIAKTIDANDFDKTLQMLQDYEEERNKA